MEQENKINENPIKAEETPDWKTQLSEMLKNAYLTGLSKGGKSFVGVIYQQLLDGKKKKQNPAKILMNLEASCKRLLGTADFNPDSKTGRQADTAEQENSESESENAENETA